MANAARTMRMDKRRSLAGVKGYRQQNRLPYCADACTKKQDRLFVPHIESLADESASHSPAERGDCNGSHLHAARTQHSGGVQDTPHPPPAARPPMYMRGVVMNTTWLNQTSSLATPPSADTRGFRNYSFLDWLQGLLASARPRSTSDASTLTRENAVQRFLKALPQKTTWVLGRRTMVCTSLRRDTRHATH